MEVRKVLFGYFRDYSGFHVIESETETVRYIFSSYLAGDSLNNIAKHLTENRVVYYQGRNTWNKNMIKRILDNDKYCGTEAYPAIITVDSFSKVHDRLLQSCKYKKTESSPVIEFLKPIVFCNVCGERFYRRSDKKGSHYWTCTNGCKSGKCLSDEQIIKPLINCLTDIQNNPDILRKNTKLNNCSFTPSLEVRKQEKEIDRLVEQGNLSFSVVSKMIIETISEKFLCCEYINSSDYADEIIKFINCIDKNNPDKAILETIINRISVNQNGSILIVFRNDGIWTDKKEN